MSADLSSLTPVANHLWQSTIFVGVIWLMTLGLKRNRAAVRYWLWFAASVKFLLPFSLLVALGSQLGWRTAAPIAQPQWSFVIDNAIQPFAASMIPTQAVSAHASFTLTPILVVAWLCGIVVGIAFWLKCWMQMGRVRRNATPVPLELPIPVLSSPAETEPGVFGIFRPVLLLPGGIESHLTSAQLDAIVAHEMAHVRRRDNLTAAIHMVVEIIFWFFPVVWWLRARLIEERENACDEAVISMGGEADSYAEGIIEVCKSYTESPAACISGISGSDLKKRVIRIVNRRAGENLTRGKRVALALASVVVVAAPLAVGLLNAPLLYAQSQTTDWEKAAGGRMKFEVASVKENTTRPPFHMHSNIPLNAQDMFTPTGGLMSSTDYPLSVYIVFAYKVPFERLSSIQSQLPKWANTDRYDIEARASGNPTKDQFRLMMQALLADRFKLVVHHETKQVPVLALVLEKSGKLGPQLRPHPADSPCPTGKSVPAMVDGGFPEVCGSFVSVPPNDPGCVRVGARNVSMAYITRWFSLGLLWDHERPLIDKTGLAGTYDIVLEVTPPADVHIPDNFQRDESGPTFLEALKDQLGLSLQSTTGPVDDLMIDHIEEPTMN